MESSEPRRVLIVANRTAATPTLLDEVRRRVSRHPHRFALLIPDAGSRSESDWTLDRAVPMLEKAAGGNVEGVVGASEAFESVKAAVAAGDYDEIIVSTLPRRTSRWLRTDLPRRIERLGLPVTVVTPDEKRKRVTVDEWASMNQHWHWTDRDRPGWVDDPDQRA
jgi:hypothetical protein